MSAYSLETTDLSHRFSRKAVVLDKIDLRVPEGSIYGFLGPNGAGKTTTLRLILGLLRSQEGRILFFGKPFAGNRVDILKKVGSLIESPSVYGQLTAVENLSVWQKVYQCPKERIATVLQWVGLADTGRKKAGHFSLGMKQRLGIAIALLNDPALLVLDEPTNGLDPGGMKEVRELLQRLNRDQGVTILLSSHLLYEMEKLVTHTGIINKGRLLFQGTLDELKGRHSGDLEGPGPRDLESIFMQLTTN
jgi:lantibiotic transport system ATP-binding protein